MVRMLSSCLIAMALLLLCGPGFAAVPRDAQAELERDTLDALRDLFRHSGSAYYFDKHPIEARRLLDEALARITPPLSVGPYTFDPGLTSQERDDLQFLIELGNLGLYLGVGQEAQNWFHLVLDRDPDQLDALIGMSEGWILWGGGYSNQARDWAEQVVALAPDDPEAHLRLARIAAADDKVFAATQHYEAAWLRDPSTIDPLLAAANLLLKDKQYEEALRWYERAGLAAPNDPRPVAGQAYSHEALSHGADATADFHRVAELDPANPDGLAQLAYEANMRGEFDEAIRLTKQARTQDPRNGRAQLELMFAYTATGQWEAARELRYEGDSAGYGHTMISLDEWVQVHEQMAADPHARRIWRYGPCCGEGEDYIEPADDAALAEATRDIEEGTPDQWDYEQRALLHERRGEFAKAYADYQAAARYPITYVSAGDESYAVEPPDPYRLVGYALLFEDLPGLREAIRLAANNEEFVGYGPQRFLFAVAIETGDWLTLGSLATEAQPDTQSGYPDVFPELALVFALRQQGRAIEAQQHLDALRTRLDKFLAANPDLHPHIRPRIALAVFERDYALALTLLEQLQAHEGAYSGPLATYGLPYQSEIDETRAALALLPELEAVEAQRMQAPDDLDLLFRETQLLVAMDRRWDALVRCRELLRRAPENAEAHYLHGRVTSSGAVRTVEYQRALELDGAHVDAALHIAEHHRAHWDDWAFEPALERLMRIAPSDPEALFLHADYWILEYPNEAVLDYQTILHQQPDNRRALIGEIEALVQADRFDEAMIRIDDLLAVDPADLEALILRMHTYHFMDDWVAARRTLEQIHTIDPGWYPFHMTAG